MNGRVDLSPVERRSDALDEVITGRRSVRAFRSDPVPRDVIEAAITAAGWAPSPHGAQPWRFVVIESLEHRSGLANAMAADWRRQLELDGQEEEIVQIRLQKGKSRLLDAPVLVLVCLYLSDLDEYPDEDRQQVEETMAIQSLGSAVQNFLLSIYANGYDAGWMCAPLFCPEIVQQHLGLDPQMIPHALLPVGRAARDPVRKPRLALDQLVIDWR